jgi:RNA polymerase sigma-70 factor (ECF subfamily)
MVAGSEQDDTVLLLAAKADPRSFAALYGRYADAVYRYCDRRLRDCHAAEDATSQVFERAFVNLSKCRHDAFRPWLFTIAHNVVVDAFRRRRHLVPLENAERVPDVCESPEDAALSGETARTVRDLLQALTPDQRAVIELRLAGLTGTESMKLLGISRPVLGARTFRAMNTMRALLQATEANAVAPERHQAHTPRRVEYRWA